MEEIKMNEPHEGNNFFCVVGLQGKRTLKKVKQSFPNMKVRKFNFSIPILCIHSHISNNKETYIQGL